MMNLVFVVSQEVYVGVLGCSGGIRRELKRGAVLNVLRANSGKSLTTYPWLPATCTTLFSLNGQLLCRDPSFFGRVLPPTPPARCSGEAPQQSLPGFAPERLRRILRPYYDACTAKVLIRGAGQSRRYSAAANGRWQQRLSAG